MTQNTPPASPPRRRSGPDRPNFIWRAVVSICRFISVVFFDLKVYGLYNIPLKGGALLISNHSSYLDPIVLSVKLDRAISFLAKSELFHHRFFGWLISSLNAFPVEQGAGDIGAMKESIARVQEGRMLNVFPEGSRSENGEIGRIERGISLMIRRAKVPVIPAVIVGTFKAWPRGQAIPLCMPVRVVIGPPMNDLWKLDRDEMLKKIDETLRTMHADLKAGKMPPLPPRPVGR